MSKLTAPDDSLSRLKEPKAEGEVHLHDEGFFPGDSMARRLGQEALGLLGGGRAILLQLAHPLVAAGVNDHSGFQDDPLKRLERTLELLHTLIFGSKREATMALFRFHAVHRKIHGSLAKATGRFPSGTKYHGNDPELKLWVLATLIDTGLVVYPHFVAPLSAAERERYYADSLQLAGMLEIPAEVMPDSLDAFFHYMEVMLASDKLVVDARTRQLARDVLQPQGVGFLPASCARLLRFVTEGLLPPNLREAYGFRWNGSKQRMLESLGKMTRLLRPLAPTWVWQHPLLEGRVARYLLWSAGE